MNKMPKQEENNNNKKWKDRKYNLSKKKYNIKENKNNVLDYKNKDNKNRMNKKEIALARTY